MSVVTKQEEGQPNEVEELVRSLDPVSYTHLTLPTKA